MKNREQFKAFIFYFLMSIILLDFGNQIRKICLEPAIQGFSLKPLFTVTQTTNTGSAFGLFSNSSLFLILLALCVLVFLTFYVWTKLTYKNKIELLSITLFAAGTLGNLIERVKFGYVIDYIKLSFIDFPIFNVFDIMICLGVTIYCLYSLFDFTKTRDYSDDCSSK